MQTEEPRGESGRGGVTGQSPGRVHRAQDLWPPRSLPTTPSALQKNTYSLLLVQRKKKKKIQQQTRTSNGRKQEGMKGRGAGRRKRSLNVRKHASKSPQGKQKEAPTLPPPPGKTKPIQKKKKRQTYI